MNKSIEQIKQEYGIFAKMGLAHMLTLPKQILTDKRVAKEIGKLHQEEKNDTALINDGAMESILLAAKDISKLELNDIIQFVKEDFSTTNDQKKEVEREENGVLAIKRVFLDYYTDEPDSLASLFNEFSLEYKIAWNHTYNSYALIDVQDNGYITIVDQVSFHEIVDRMKEIYPEIYEEVLLEAEDNKKLR